MSRLKHDALSQSRQEWRQPQAFRIELTFAGLRAECSTCHGGGQVVWSYLGIVQFAPAFRFECSQCGNQLQRRILNGTAAFPESPASP